MALLLAREIASGRQAARRLPDWCSSRRARLHQQRCKRFFAGDWRRQVEDLTKGVWLRPSDSGEGTPYPTARRLIEEAATISLLGSKIDVVEAAGPHSAASGRATLSRHGTARRRKMKVTMIQDGDHRLSRLQDIARIIAAVAEVG